MNNIIDIATGEVKVGKNSEMLVSNAIGSCIAVIALDTEQKIGGIAHVMLSGRAPDHEQNKTKYVHNAIEELFRKMCACECVENNLKVFIAGGGNVMKSKDDNICRDNIRSTVEFLKSKGINIFKKAVGGNERRAVRLDIYNSIVYYCEGNGLEKIFWKADTK